MGSEPRVLVIGAGVIGCTAALALARRGARVTVLERDAIAAGASQAAAGMLAPLSESDAPGCMASAGLEALALHKRSVQALEEITPGIEATARGPVVAGQDGATGRPGDFAAGDCVRGADLVVTAIADARRAADAMDRLLAS